MSERDKKRYHKIKADPVLYAAYLERKRKEQLRRNAAGNGRTTRYDTERKRKWRAKNPEAAQQLRKANHAVEYAIFTGKLVRPNTCDNCGILAEKIEAHHHKGYAPEHRLDVIWLCVFCHRKADKTV